MKKSVSLILPTYNEKENIGELIRLILLHVPELHEIIVVDDNSPDGTADIVRKLATENEKIRIIKRISERGLPSAIARGIKESSGNVVGWMDADFGMPPSFLPNLLELIPSYDVAVGSRYVVGGKDMRLPIRKIPSRAINIFTNIFLGFSIKDYDSGFIVAKKSVFEKVNIKGGKDIYGQYCIRFLYDCLKNGFTVKELGYTFTERKLGKSKTGDIVWPLLKHGWNYGVEVMKIRFGR